jgi:hypothetical protein
MVVAVIVPSLGSQGRHKVLHHFTPPTSETCVQGFDVRYVTTS